MISEIINNIFDILIIILLLITIFYAAKLSRMASTFKRIEKDKENMEAVVEQLSNIIDKANLAIANMKETANSDGTNLQKNIDTAIKLSDELEIIVSSGNSLIKRLQQTKKYISNVNQQNISKETLLSAIKENKGLYR